MDASAIVSASLFVLASAAAAAPGVVFRPGEWYRRLEKPRWCPPDRLFAPVWSVLYLAIAASGWLVWRAAGADAAGALAVYAAQLVLNGLWSSVFFGLRRPGLAFVEILLLLASILATIAAFAPVEPAAAWLLVPYLLWVGFAAALNFRVWRLNARSTSPPA